MALYFLGVLCALGITIGLMLDLERKRRRLRQLALRLEEITRGQVRSRVRHVRRLTLSMFMYEQLLGQLHDEIFAIEQERGLEPGKLGGRDFYFLENRIKRLEERVERLAATSPD